ncbi:organic cation/carnitine transporter 2-like isoform X2 [Ptychodera flava]|uniref:organic cation/carnitine transporter 2-like isoform X2 n=1 Tax=Ptychodera flava TaxID=63121 RepID=UPI00396A959D
MAEGTGTVCSLRWNDCRIRHLRNNFRQVWKTAGDFLGFAYPKRLLLPVCGIATSRHVHFLSVHRWLHIPRYTGGIVYIRLIPESPRWLLSLGHVNEADIIIREAVRANQKTLPSSYFTYTRLSSYGDRPQKIKTHKPETSSKSRSNSHNFTDLFKTPKLRQTTLIILCNWFSVVLPYLDYRCFRRHLPATDMSISSCLGW